MPLDDVRVLDLSHALAGPFCSTMLADFGAEVIKLEPKGDGDIARAWGTRLPGGETAYFVSLHRNKKGIEVDLKHPDGKALFLDLVDRCDVVLENYRVGALERLGLGYEVARARNPRIIYCSVSGFGQDGPYRDRAALDLILQAESGMISVTGEEGGHGVRCGVSIADMTAGMYAAYGIMLALRARERTGRGQAIDVSMLEGQLSLLGTMIGGFLADGQIPAPMGTAYKALLPYQTFRTRTRDLALAVGSEKLWKVFCPVIGCPELADDPRYRTNADRAKHRDTLIPRLQEVFLARSYEEWEPLLLASGIPFGAINGIAEVVDHPQVAARNALVEVDHPRAGKVRIVGAPVRLSETPGAVRTPSPSLGEHTEEVLRDVLRLGDEAIQALRASGVIGARRRGASGS
jgi:formyl-CoA transferase/CoA:oxalate CoA-transferase